jgi:hypothetical protein
MDHLVDYIQWMGDLPFSVLPFNEADALVLGMLSYYDLAPMFPQGGKSAVPLRESLRLLEKGPVRVMLVGRDRGFQKILDCAARSRRYGELLLRDYVDLYRQEPPLQFCAMTFCAPEFRFIAFRGTDNSLAGWEEDFMISFTVTEAQRLAADYAARAVTAAQPCYIGGHSKGGNLALYAACMLPPKDWEHVTRLFLLDGPGICPEVMDDSCLKRIDARTTKIQPAFSIVGKLFEPAITDSRIVQSSASGFVQHSLDTWGIDHGKLLLADGPNPRSVWINDLLARWIGGISQEDRVVFVQELFDALAANGADSFDDIEEGGVGGFEAILTKFFASSEVTRKTVYDLPKRVLLGEYYDAITQKGFGGWLKDGLQSLQNQVLDLRPRTEEEQQEKTEKADGAE